MFRLIELAPSLFDDREVFLFPLDTFFQGLTVIFYDFDRQLFETMPQPYDYPG